METDVILISFILTMAQLSDAYLRYLAFKDCMSEKDRRRLWGFFLAWGFLDGGLLYCWLFSHMGVTALPYKAVLMLGWIPYMVIFMAIVRGQVFQHVFVFGMSAVWGFLQHNWSNIAVAIFLTESPEGTVLITHGALYLLWFALAWPLERRMFSNLMESRKFFDLRPLGIYIAFLPIAILLGHLLLMADGRLWHSWAERFSRIFLPLAFFFFYRYILIASKDFYDQRRAEQNHRLMSDQLSSLWEYSHLMQESGERISSLRHELNQKYCAIRTMIKNGDIAKAKESVAAELAKIKSVQNISYPSAPLLSAVLSTYINRAEKMGCKVNALVDLPEKWLTSENDLALLMSNVLLRATNAGRTQPEGKRNIIFTLRISGEKGTLELMNRHERNLPLDEKGWPKDDPMIDENGTGVLSLTAFVKKYKARASFYQRDGWVRMSLGWEDQRL